MRIRSFTIKLIIFIFILNSFGLSLLISQVPKDPEKLNSLNVEIPDVIVQPPIEELPVSSALPSTPKYSRERAFDYAYVWWDSANSLYNDYSSSGGDCANFVSQCLIAGGLSLHKGTNGEGYGVYPDTPRPTQYSYGTIPYCDFLNTHLRNYQNTNVTFVNEASAYIPDEIAVGDVVIFGEDPGDNWEHAMVVVWDNGTFDIGLAGHSSQVWNRSFWTEIGYATFDCATFYHIEDEMTENYHFRVNTGALNVRVGPGLNDLGDNYQDIGDLHNGEEYVAFEIEKDEQGRNWWHFWFDERPAWTAGWYTINVTGNTIVETDVTTYLNVRDGPGAGYTDVGDTYDGMRYVSDIMDSGWYRYWYAGAQRYSSGSLMTEVAETETINSSFIKPVMGFLPYWVDGNQNYSVVSHLAWFAVELNADGTIGNTHGWPDWDVIDAVHEAGNKVVLTVTMFSATNIHTLLTSYKTTAANNLLAQVEAGNADGICIDFETPQQSSDKALLVEFMDILYNTFKTARNDYHISICTPSVDWYNTFDYDELDPNVDAFMLMGYGYYWSGSSYAGPTAPLEGGTYNLNWSVNDHLYYGVSKSKLILGLPFYGFDWPVSNTNKNAPTTGSGSARIYSAVQSLISTYSPTVYYDDVAECAWFNYYSGGQRQVWFDNYTSLERKFQYILDRDLGGLGIWAYGYQGAYTDLEQLIYDKFISNETTKAYSPGAFTAITSADSPDTDGRFYINWSYSSGADNYSIFRSNIPMNTPGSGILYLSGVTTNSSLISNMMSGVYYFAVVAYNETGMTSSNNILISISLNFTLSSNAGTPDKDGDFYLYWDNQSSVDNYTLYSYDYPITEFNGSLHEIDKDLMVNTYEITGITNDTTKYYMVVARNGSLNMTSNYLIINVLYGPPGEFTAMSTADYKDKDGNFYVSWDIPDGGYKYSIYRSRKYIFNLYENRSSLVEVVIDTVTPKQYISGLKAGTHYIIVVALNDYGNSSSNCLTINVVLPKESGEEREQFDIISFMTSPFGILLVSFITGAIVGLVAIIKRRGSHKTSLKEREKLEKISEHAKRYRPD